MGPVAQLGPVTPRDLYRKSFQFYLWTRLPLSIYPCWALVVKQKKTYPVDLQCPLLPMFI